MRGTGRPRAHRRHGCRDLLQERFATRHAYPSTRGCIVLERPDLLHELVVLHEARDTTARKTALEELAAMRHRPSQYAPGNEVPEKNWYYRFAKKHFFNDFGAYTHSNL